jgi:inner membrane protein
MDPITHGLIGASLSASASALFLTHHRSWSSSPSLRSAALVGGISAMLPDLDVFIQSASDPLLQLEFHRQFTHSLLFLPLGALLAVTLCWWIVRNHLNVKQTYIFSFLGMSTAGLVDVMTSYGVQWFWPLSEARISWNVIAVFDPLCTLGIAMLLGWGLYRKRHLFAGLALAWATLFFLFGWIQQGRAERQAQILIQQRNHISEQLVVKPTIANQILWSIRYTYRDTLYADAVHLLPFAEPKIYRGTTQPLLEPSEAFDSLTGSVLYNDIKRFSRLSNEIIIRHPVYPDVIGDGRYAMLPTSTNPLWGIRIDTTQPDQHVAFETFRDASAQVRKKYRDMLLGY